MKKEPKWVCVCGSRSITNQRAVQEKLDALLFWFDSIVIVTGACDRGPDVFAENWAHKNRYTLKRFHADWDAHKKGAGPIRNREMAKEVVARNGYLIAFWDGISTGTASMIEEFRRAGGKESHIRIVRSI